MKEVNHEILLHAADLVKKGYAQWKPEMDEVKVEEIFREWKTPKDGWHHVREQAALSWHGPLSYPNLKSTDLH